MNDSGCVTVIKSRAIWVAALLALTVIVSVQKIPAIAPLPDDLPPQVRQELQQRRDKLAAERNALRARIASHDAQCSNVATDSAQGQTCRQSRALLEDEKGTHIHATDQFNTEVQAAITAWRNCGSNDPNVVDLCHAGTMTVDPNRITGIHKTFYALQARTLTPMNDGGHPIDAAGSPTKRLHGLVGGTTWTYGFQWPHVNCDQKCREDMKRSLDSQLALFCSSQSDVKACLAEGLPFTPDMYDLVVSMGSYHSAIGDLASRVLFDGTTFGEFSRQNKEIFASLKGRQFETLDCHSNGAMICLAALRSGDTTAREVRLFGPQMNAEAAKRWQEYAESTGTKIRVYINSGDPITPISWKQPTPQTPAGSAATAAWLVNPVTGPAAFAEPLFNSYWDSKNAVMDETLRRYGFDVTRSKCRDVPTLNCHSMKVYEKELDK